MASQNTVNTTAFQHAQQYSSFILQNLHDGLLPEAFYRNVSDFGQGSTLNIKTIGSATLQEVSEEVPLTYFPIDTGTVTLSITDYVGDAWSVTDVLKQDGSQIETLMAMRAMEATRAIQERFETRYLAVANAAQTASNLNLINGYAHRFVASGGNDTMSIKDISDMTLAFDMAHVPQAGRIAIVHPVVEATLRNLWQGSYHVDSNPRFQSLLENNFSQNHKFVMNIFGWDIWTSTRLPLIASETVNAVQVTGGVANIFMSVLDDNLKPLMAAWRQMPKVESERNKDFQRDEFLTTARWGVGSQRQDTLGVILTSATATTTGS